MHLDNPSSVWSASLTMSHVMVNCLTDSCCMCCFQVLEAGGVMQLEPQLSSLQHLTRLGVIRAPLHTRGVAAAAALTAVHRLRELRLRGGPGKAITKLSKPMADALTQLTGLVRLELLRHSLSEQQLCSLCGLTRLTHLIFRSDQLGVLLLDRLGSLCGDISPHCTATFEFAPGKVSGWSSIPLFHSVSAVSDKLAWNGGSCRIQVQGAYSICSSSMLILPSLACVCWQFRQCGRQ